MKKEQYISPFTRVVTMLESNGVVCTSDDQETLIKLDTLEEEYYGKTDNHNDYLIKL